MIQLQEMLFEQSPPQFSSTNINNTTLLNDQIPKEPLITKAYDAFRKKSKEDQSDLMPTDEYLLELARRQFEAKSLSASSKTFANLSYGRTFARKDKSLSHASSNEQVNIQTI